MKYSLVRKLDDADSAVVQKIVDEIYTTAAVIGWEFTNFACDSDIILVVGGDGTMLVGMQYSHEFKIPVVGINLGKVGFLAEHDPKDAVRALVDIAANVANPQNLDNRSVIQELNSEHSAINEFVISPEFAKDTIKYEFFINGISSGKHHANGLIVATPTGSTAYSLSVGGAIIQPNAPVFQIVPVAPMSLNSRSIVISDDADIKVKIFARANYKYVLLADGQIADTRAREENGVLEFVFKKSSRAVTLLHSKSWNFFTVIQEKLHWNTII